MNAAKAYYPLRQLGANLLAVDLADVARHVITESQDPADTAGVDVRTRLEPAPVSGDPVLLERLIQNLVDNAIRYNMPQDGQVTVTTGTAGDSTYLTVENTGPPVPPYEIPNLFQPFRRSPATERRADPGTAPISRGAGLGLSIVRAVVHAHGGDVQASARRDGGLIARARIPARPKQHELGDQEDNIRR